MVVVGEGAREALGPARVVLAVAVRCSNLLGVLLADSRRRRGTVG
jgi:hypothetical protein